MENAVSPITLSVVLPNYNHASVLPVALRALLDQSRAPDEIVVVDDGSTDHSRDLLAEIASREPSIRVITLTENAGAIPALNRGLAASRGRYVYLAAADDWVLPGFFERATRQLESAPNLGFFCGASRLVDGPSGRAIGSRPAAMPLYRGGALTPDRVKRLLRTTDNWALTGASVFRRDALVGAGGFDERLGSFADGILVRKVALRHGFYFDPRTVAVWAVYPESVSRRTATDPELAAASLHRLPESLADDGSFPSWYPAVFARRWRFAVGRIAIGARPYDTSALAAVGFSSPVDGLVLGRLCSSLPQGLGRIVGLAWLTARVRPVALRGLGRLALSAYHRRCASTDVEWTPTRVY